MSDLTTAERFWSKVEITDRCWLWTAATSRGYGKFNVGARPNGSGIMVPAHRWAYEHLVGPIPAGFQIDHLCRVTECVNPDHLEAVTPRVNVLRSESVSAKAAARTHCPQGHAYEDHGRTNKRNGWRQCRVCDRERQRRARAT